MNKPKVSLIIPLFNAGNFIQHTLSSALNQTYNNLEIIVVNDGSTDNSEHKVRALMADNNIILINQDNAGVSAARNKGIEHSSGEYICFADSDDILSPDYVDYLVSNAIEAKAEISISTGIFTNYKFGNFRNQAKNDYKYFSMDPNEAILKMLTYWFPIGCYCRVFHRSLFDKGLRFIEGQKVGEGFTFNVKALLLASNVVVGHKPIYCYRRDNSASCMTAFNIDRAKEAVHSIQIIKSLFESPSDSVSNALNFAEWHTKGDMYNWMKLTGNQKKYRIEAKDYCNFIKKYSKNALGMHISKKEKFRALIQNIHPNLLVLLLKLRKNI